MENRPVNGLHSRVVLGTFGSAHLGDTLCTSTLPRRIHEKYGKPVYVTKHPMLRAVFDNNPYVAGIDGRATLALDRRMRGHGHVLQRLEQGLGLPIDPLAKPEIYLDDEEREWAGEQRRKWSADRPVCVVSTEAITDRRNVEGVDWETLSRILAGIFTVVQPVLSEKELPNAIVYRGLSVRKYMALISVADYFVGGTTGGSHVAAAFDTPALIVAWKTLLESLLFPVSGAGVVTAFLYPQQWFIAAEVLRAGRFNQNPLLKILDDMRCHGRKGRPTSIGNHSRHPCGFVPAVAKGLMKTGNRFVREVGIIG